MSAPATDAGASDAIFAASEVAPETPPAPVIDSPPGVSSELVRAVYYTSVATLPALVSTAILMKW